MQMRNALFPRIETAAGEGGLSELAADTTPSFGMVRRVLERGYRQPFLVVDSDLIRSKARRFIDAMPRVRPHYAVKANPHPDVLRTLVEEGVGFEIASVAELELLMDLGVPAREIYYSNPIKSRDYLQCAARAGVEWYVLDCVEELEKIDEVKPDAKLYVRIDAPNVGSDWPLSGKFGAHGEEVREIIAAAVRLKADLAGVTFHVGSQCRNPENWRVGIESAKRVMAQMRMAGLTPRLLNIGGGYPVLHTKPIPAIEDIAAVVNAALADVPEEVRVMAEPGRYLVSDAAWFVCRVIGTATRAGKRWMYWDAGVFGGLIETMEGLEYRVLTDRNGPSIPWTVAGPTCDSVDVVLREHLLPGDLREGDFVYIPNAGAYTSAYASGFNGFPLPEVIVGAFGGSH